MSFDELKKKRHEDTERLRKQMEKDWIEIVKERLISIAARFGVQWSDDAKVNSRRIR